MYFSGALENRKWSEPTGTASFNTFALVISTPLAADAALALQSGSSLKQSTGLFLNARPSQGGENSVMFRQLIKS